MFDVVGRPTPRSPARRVGAFLLSLSVNGGLLGLALLLGAKGAEAVVVTEAPIERPVEFVISSLVEAPAPAGPPSARRRTSPAPPPSAAPTPPPLAPVEPSPDVAAVPDGPPGPPSDGIGDTDGPPGPPGGPGGPGSGPGGNGTGVKIVHWSEVIVKVRPQARASDYPEAARALGLPGARCTVRLRIDERGTPVEVTAKSCPEVFRTSAESVGMRYRFYPLKVDGRAVQAAFDLTLNFVDG